MLFGKPLSKMQNTQFKMVEMKTQIAAAKALIRRYEFFEYLGPLNPEDGEAICKSDCENDPLGLGGTHPNYVGAYVGAQMAGFNVEAIHAAVPEPQGWAMMLAGLGVIGMCAYRRSASW